MAHAAGGRGRAFRARRKRRALDRGALRLLRQELRRAEALAVAARALRRRDLSQRGIAERLARASVAPAAVEESLAVLSRAGLVDDARFARTRVPTRSPNEATATRPSGTTSGDRGLPGEMIEASLESLEPEAERARRLVERRGPGMKTARYLASKGFRRGGSGSRCWSRFCARPMNGVRCRCLIQRFCLHRNVFPNR